MRILFVVSRMAYVRHFDRAVRLLADRGHEICLASQDDDVELPALARDHTRVTGVAAPRNRTDTWTGAAGVVRRARDYVRYLHPRYASARQLRARAFAKLVHAVGPSREVGEAWSELLLGMNKKEQKRIDALLVKLESAIPPDPDIHAFVAARRPDAVVLSPMVGVGFSQADFVKSARALGIPTGMLAFSWDNLSNKGLIHEMPDRMFVWNEVQSREAVTLHRYPAERIVVTGAPRFDAFFEMQPATTRDEFCRLAGLEAGRPIVTYLCSSKFVAGRERAFVERWIGELRHGPDAALAGCNVVVRPHPGAMKYWFSDAQSIPWPGPATDKVAIARPLNDLRSVVIGSPMQNASEVLYDTIYHSAAIVGLNTSAEIEAAIVGRPVYTIIDPGAGGQQGTLHFHYLLRGRGGHVELAETFDRHRALLSEALAGRHDRHAIETFVRMFVRPRGTRTPVAPIVADAIEELATVHTPPAPALSRQGV